jgi:hypothetical protein
VRFFEFEFELYCCTYSILLFSFVHSLFDSLTMDDDLSAYEKLRLANIRRNSEFLAQLGLETVKLSNISKTSKQTTDDNKDEVIKPTKRERKNDISRRHTEPSRKSARLSGSSSPNAAQIEKNSATDKPDEDTDSDEIDYDSMPMDSSELDDCEFEVYASLRKWRLLTSRELEIEPYKICQNRTIAELVRRRRNNSAWAARTDDSDASDTKISEDLVECWGVGKHKARKEGLMFQMVTQLNNDKRLLELLEKSRTTENVVVEDSTQ